MVMVPDIFPPIQWKQSLIYYANIPVVSQFS